MALKYVLLTLLQKKPQTGYQIVQSFESSVGYFWHASHQQVYRELNTLATAAHVSAKHVKQTDKPDKKIYSITKSGRLALKKWLESPAKRTATKDPLLVKLINANADNYQSMISELEGLRSDVKERLGVYNAIEKEHYSETKRQQMSADSLVLYIALRKGILGLNAQLSWIDEAVKLLGRFATSIGRPSDH